MAGECFGWYIVIQYFILMITSICIHYYILHLVNLC
uniref:Uncharacterized protein n=1 Tax=Anguilla anguilla TaxID=7936 RepID=A0A0E9PZW3_ANGAN